MAEDDLFAEGVLSKWVPSSFAIRFTEARLQQCAFYSMANMKQICKTGSTGERVLHHSPSKETNLMALLFNFCGVLEVYAMWLFLNGPAARF